MLVPGTPSNPVTSGVKAGRTPDREHGCCGNMAAALQMLRHADDERERQSIQWVMAQEMVGNPPRFRTGRLRAEGTVVSDWQPFTRLRDSLAARRHSFMR